MLENEAFDRSGPEGWWLGRPYCLRLRSIIHEVAGATMTIPRNEIGQSGTGSVEVQRPIVMNLWSDYQIFGSKRVGYYHFALEQALACADIIGLDVYELHGADPR